MYALIRILLNNGWKLTNNQKNCELKWVNQCKHNAFSELSKQTKINHFPHSHNLTTKLGLCKTFSMQRGAFIGDTGMSYTHFYPRGYDLR